MKKEGFMKKMWLLDNGFSFSEFIFYFLMNLFGSVAVNPTIKLLIFSEIWFLCQALGPNNSNFVFTSLFV